MSAGTDPLESSSSALALVVVGRRDQLAFRIGSAAAGAGGGVGGSGGDGLSSLELVPLLIALAQLLNVPAQTLGVSLPRFCRMEDGPCHLVSQNCITVQVID